jgi:hypothetical protein
MLYFQMNKTALGRKVIYFYMAQAYKLMYPSCQLCRYTAEVNF